MCRLASLMLPLVLAPVGLAAQNVDPARTLEAHVRYLERRPYHSHVFEQFLELARETEVLESWRTRFVERANGGEIFAAVLAARLDAARGEVDMALERLEALAGNEPSRDALRARLLRAAGRDEQAALAYARAVQGFRTGDERVELLGEQAELLLHLGRLDGAREAYGALADERPDDLLLRLDVAEACARGGLVDEALAHYRAGLEIAVGDPEAESRAHFALGRLAEERGHDGESAASYRAALERLGRGHWLRGEVFERLLALERRRGALAEWRAELASKLEIAAGDLLALEDLAQVAIAMGEPDEAAEFLARAAEGYPSDAALADRRIDLARVTGHFDEWIELLQARTVRGGERPELLLELADAYLELDRREPARAVWEQLATLGESRPGLLAEIARRRADAGEDGPVVELLARVVAVAPEDVRGYVELVQHHWAHGRPDEALAVLERAARALPKGGLAREELAQLWLEAGSPERAWRELAALLALDPDNMRRTQLVADALVRLDRGGEGRALLRPWIERTFERARLTRLIAATLDSYATPAESAAAIAREAEGVLAGTGDRAAFWIAVRGRGRLRDAAGALVLLDTGPVGGTEDELLVLEERAELTLAVGDLDAAAAALDALAVRASDQDFALELRLVSRLRADQRVDEARIRLARLSPERDAPATRLRSLAITHWELGNTRVAIEYTERAAQLAVDDARLWSELAELCRTEFRFAEALEHDLTAYRFGGDELRRELSINLEHFLDEHGRVDAEVRRLTALAEGRPLESWATLLAVDLLAAQGHPLDALELLSARIGDLPFEPKLVAKRADLFERMGLATEHRSALEVLRSMSPGGEVDLQLLVARLTDEREAWVGDLLATASNPTQAGAILTSFGRFADARELLERARRRRPSVEVDVQLADAYAGLDRPRDEALALERVVAAVDVPDRRMLERLGKLQHALENRERALEIGRMLLARGRPEVARGYYGDLDEVQAWADASCAVARTRVGGEEKRLWETYEDLVVDTTAHGALMGLLDELVVLAVEEQLAPEGRSPAHFALELCARHTGIGTGWSEFDPARPATWVCAAFGADEPPDAAAWRAARSRWGGEPAAGAALVKLGVRTPTLRLESARLAVELAARLARLPDRALVELETCTRRLQVEVELRALRRRRSSPFEGVPAWEDLVPWLEGVRRAEGGARWLDPDRLLLAAAEAAFFAQDESLVDEALAALEERVPSDPLAALAHVEALVRADRDEDEALSSLTARFLALGLHASATDRIGLEAGIWQRLRDAYLESGRDGEGFEMLRRAGQHPLAWALLDVPGARESCLSSLRARLEALLEGDPESSDIADGAVDLVVLISDVAAAGDSHEAVLADLDRAAEMFGSHPALHALRGQVLEQAGRPAEAFQCWLTSVRIAEGSSPGAQSSAGGLEFHLQPQDPGDPGTWSRLEAGVSDALGLYRLRALRLALITGERPIALEQVARLLETDSPRDEPWLRNILRATRLLVPKQEVVDWMGELHRLAPRNLTLFRVYVEALRGARRLGEARITIAAFAAGRELSEKEKALVRVLDRRVP